MEAHAAERLLAKLRHFIATELDQDERALLGALVAPGVARAHPDPDAEVQGFAAGGWAPGDLPEALVNALRDADVRVEGLGL
ncbi:MAG: hypothetical protein M3066_20610 [Actinomycetota bacterium]|nr:hypothetical protein [Actinomycetota bacterium]